MNYLPIIIIVLYLLLFIACEKEGNVLESVGESQKALQVHNKFRDTYPDEDNNDIHSLCLKKDIAHIVYPPCDCFSMEELEALFKVQPWPFGWFSDVPGSCKEEPYNQLMEVWLTNIGLPIRNVDFSVQAGTINGRPFASKAKFNHLTSQFEARCGGYTTPQNASNCAMILHDFIDQMRSSHPNWDYCVRFP